MTRRKKILLAAGGTLGSVLVALVVLPFLFVDQVEARVRAEVERAARVQVAWSDIGLTFFKNFPHPTFSLTGLTVIGTGPFAGDTLAAVGDFRLVLNGTSLIGAIRGSGPLVIRSVRLIEPTLRFRVNDDGAANWDVLPEADGSGNAPGETSGSGVAVSLHNFELTDGDIVVDDARSGLFISLERLSHSLDGDFSRESLVARTSTHSDVATLRFAGATYLGGVSLAADADFDIDVGARRARLIDNELRLNDLAVRLQGDLAREGEDLALDLSFEAPSTEFGQILSLVPVVYAQEFASLETSGAFSLGGSIAGAYGEDAFPSFAIELEVVDGRFRYPDLALPAESIAARLSIRNPGGDLDSTVVDLSHFHIEIDDQPLDATLTLRTPVSDPEVDVQARGTLDLADVGRTVKLEGAEGLGGVVALDASLRARRSDVDSARYDRIAARGSLSARDVTLRGESLRQPVDVRELMVDFTPEAAQLRSFDSRLGSSDVQATGRLDNVLGFALGQQPLSGTANFTSSRLMLDEWRSDNELAVIAVPGMFDLTLDGTVAELVYAGLSMTDVRGRAIVRDQRATFQGLSLQTLGGRVGADGFYETSDPTRPTFGLDLVLDSLDVAGASEALLTVRTLAPVARYARGTFSSALNLTGALGEDMVPALDVLEGDGSLSTSRVAIDGFPMLDRLSETLRLQPLSSPTVEAIRSNIRIRGGRLFVEPFQVGVAGLTMTVSGSNGIDQSVDYTIGLQVPRAGFAADALTSLASRAGPLGAALAATDPVRVGTRVTGTVRQPTLNVSLSETTESVRGAATQSAETAVRQRIDEGRDRLDASEEAARQRARAQADSIVAGAQRQADAIRAEAGRAAAEVRAEGNRAADEVVARATNPLTRRAAEPVANRIRREADERAATIEREADERASALLTAAQARAEALVGGL